MGGRELKGETLEVVLDLGPGPLTRGPPSVRMALPASEWRGPSRTAQRPSGLLGTAECAPPGRRDAWGSLRPPSGAFQELSEGLAAAV